MNPSVHEAFAAATAHRGTANWAHYHTRTDQLVECDGGDASCGRCAEAANAAQAAEAAAARCVAAAEAGDWDAALADAQAAIGIEALFFENSRWRALLTSVIAAASRP